jgi:phage anti-repressor protein
MLEIINSNNSNFVKATELYDLLGMNKAVYSRWCKSQIVENPFAEIEKDYSTFVLNGNQGGRARQEFLLSPDFAKKLCMVSKSKKGEDIRNWLLQLSNARDNKDLLTVKEFVWINKFIQRYKFLDNQEELEKQCIKNLAKNNDNNFGKAHNIRNKNTNSSKEEVDKQFLEWLSNNSGYYPKQLTKRQKLFYCNKFKLIANSVWDFWQENNLPDTSNWLNVIIKVAEEMDITLYPKNQDDLFRCEEKILSQEALAETLLKQSKNLN